MLVDGELSERPSKRARQLAGIPPDPAQASKTPSDGPRFEKVENPPPITLLACTGLDDPDADVPEAREGGEEGEEQAVDAHAPDVEAGHGFGEVWSSMSQGTRKEPDAASWECWSGEEEGAGGVVPVAGDSGEVGETPSPRPRWEELNGICEDVE